MLGAVGAAIAPPEDAARSDSLRSERIQRAHFPLASREHPLDARIGEGAEGRASRAPRSQSHLPSHHRGIQTYCQFCVLYNKQQQQKKHYSIDYLWFLERLKNIRRFVEAYMFQE